VSTGFQLLDPPPVGGEPDGSPANGSGDDPRVERDRSELRHVQQVPGGYVSSGRVDADAYTGPVLWVSKDGQSWQWIPLPVSRPDASVLATDVDDDVILLASSDTESRAWRVPDIAGVIASIPTGS
jgi:hypothetical protein